MIESASAIDVTFRPVQPDRTTDNGERAFEALGPTATDNVLHKPRRLTLWLLALIDAISSAEHAHELDELIAEGGNTT